VLLGMVVAIFLLFSFLPAFGFVFVILLLPLARLVLVGS
jgi:hypothetical protein